MFETDKNRMWVQFLPIFKVMFKSIGLKLKSRAVDLKQLGFRFLSGFLRKTPYHHRTSQITLWWWTDLDQMSEDRSKSIRPFTHVFCCCTFREKETKVCTGSSIWSMGFFGRKNIHYSNLSFLFLPWYKACESSTLISK